MKKQNTTNLPGLFLSCFIAFMLLSNIAAAQWSELGGTNALAANYDITSICADKLGNIYAVGGFTTGTYNDEGHNYVAKWNGTHWSELGAINDSIFNQPIYTVCSDTAGNIYVGGDFTNASGNYYVAKFDGTSWSEFGGTNSLAANGPVISVYIDAAGNIYAAGGFTNSSGSVYAAKWNGTSWSELGGNNSMKGTMGDINTVCSDAAGNMYAAGPFISSNGQIELNEWNDTIWSLLATTPSFNNSVFSICSGGTGSVYVGGAFTNSLPEMGNEYVAQWNGSTWSELGGVNTLAANNYILAVYMDATGNIYAAGQFTNGSSNYYVAKYDGGTWTELGGTNALAANQYIQTICSDAAGHIYAAGVFTNSSNKMYVAEFGGHSTTGVEPLLNTLPALMLYPNPATNQVTIVSPQNMQCLKVLNQCGAVVKHIENLNDKQHILNLSDLAKGMYYLQVNNESAWQKLVVQ